MLSTEVADYYGVKDGALCADFVAFINGMLGFAETSRRECWGHLCLGMINVQAKVKALQGSQSELEAKFNDLGEQYKKSLALSERLNVSNRDYIVQIESLKSQLLSGSRTPSAAVEPSKLQIEPAKARTSSTVITKPEAQRAKRAFPEPAPDSADDDDQPPPAKRDKTEIIIELRKKITALMAENERLDRLFASLKKVDPPSAETGKTRMTQEEMGRLRKANAELETRLASVTAEAHRQAHQYTEFIKENDAVWERERLEWAKRIEELSKDSGSETMRIEEHNKNSGTARIEDLSKNSGGGVAAPSILLPSVFSLPCGTIMACPVPIRTGRLVPLIEVYQSWIRYPSDNEGTFFATFVCPYTTRLTSLASAEEVTLLHGIASELRLFTIPPLRFQYYINGSWIDFSFVDQIIIAAVCCKLYRLGTSRAVENVMVCHGDFIFKVHVSNNLVDFQMQPVHNRAKTVPACLLECVTDFFQRWTFPTGGDDQEADSQ
jgi:uncharacterized protein YdcH (DUF465 family)